ncbi:TcpE family conjugal transfer membrane protein [Nonomuraea sp. NBC_01738]|uniref:conjugal transfer protein n=1 Tax=Nonomuraea sp. NBC_01738 TaxID=2976003 RepID=UPI002E1080A6|nr:TcpE family conjugal transfer membrane protein [Nonomuraea sp. NBC_01738]
MDLPTYTNIWRIEKRLYKLYDLRLPMPLPIVWIGVFVGVLAPWSFLLWLVGLPFAAPWHVVYLVPPGIVTWLSTRPVIENKRLTELLQSQLRYMGEPRVWCRMAPAAEPETVTFAGRVWRAMPARVKAVRKAKQPKTSRHAQRKRATAPAPAREVRPAVAAAAAAASQAPVADTSTARTRWGTKSAAPALPVRAQDPGVRQAHETVASPEPLPIKARGVPADAPVDARDARVVPARLSGNSRKGRAAAADQPPAVDPREVREHAVPDPVLRSLPALPDAERPVPPESAPVAGAPEAEGRVVPSPGTPEGRAVPSSESAKREAEAVQTRAEAVPAQPVTGKPIDTEALRRLRRLAATADTPAPEEQDDARLQHRKGHPPKPGVPLALPGGRQVFPATDETAAHPDTPATHPDAAATPSQAEPANPARPAPPAKPAGPVAPVDLPTSPAAASKGLATPAKQQEAAPKTPAKQQEAAPETPRRWGDLQQPAPAAPAARADRPGGREGAPGRSDVAAKRDSAPRCGAATRAGCPCRGQVSGKGGYGGSSPSSGATPAAGGASRRSSSGAAGRAPTGPRSTRPGPEPCSAGAAGSSCSAAPAAPGRAPPRSCWGTPSPGTATTGSSPSMPTSGTTR